MKMKKVALIILVILLGLVIGFCIHLERTSEMSIQETELIDDASETTASVETAATEAAETETQETVGPIESAVTNPPATNPPATNPPATNPPANESPTTPPTSPGFGTMLPDVEL